MNTMIGKGKVGGFAGKRHFNKNNPVSSGMLHIGKGIGNLTFDGDPNRFPDQAETLDDLQADMETVRNYNDLEALVDANRNGTAIVKARKAQRQREEEEQAALTTQLFKEKPNWANVDRIKSQIEIDRLGIV